MSAPPSSSSTADRYQLTRDHLQRAKALAEDGKSSGRLQGKVGIVSGVGSLKGIGVRACELACLGK